MNLKLRMNMKKVIGQQEKALLNGEDWIIASIK